MKNEKVRLWLISFIVMLGLAGIFYTPITVNAASDDTGTWGTVDWEFEASTGTLTFKNEGTLPPVGMPDSRNWFTSDSTEGGQAIKKIVFEQTCVLPTNSSYMFYDLPNLEGIVGFDKLDLSNVKNMACMFDGCISLKNIDELANWDMSNVTTIWDMFSGTNINHVNSLANWNVSNVTDMRALFAYCKSLEDISGLTNWNVSNVTDMSRLFERCESLEDISALANWDVSNVTDMRLLFYLNRKLGNITPIANWNVEKVAALSFAFSSTNIKNTDALANWNTVSLNRLDGLFESCSNLENADALRNWAVTPAHVSQRMFYKCGNFKSVDLSSLNTKGITPDENSFLEMFFGCNQLESITLGKDSVFNSTVQLSAIDTTSGHYTGEWIGINTGNIYSSSDDFMTNYDGSIPDTYVWRVTPNETPTDLSTLIVRDSELYVGDTWNPEDNFVSASDYLGNPLTFEVIHYNGVVDTSTPGTYPVEYFRGVPNQARAVGTYYATAIITVKEREMPESLTYNVDYTFVSGTTGKALPKAVTDLLPSDPADYENGAVVTAIAPAKTTVTVSDGTWTFQGWDADSKTVSGDDVIFTGTWTFEAGEADTTDKPDAPSTPDKPSKPDTPSNQKTPDSPKKTGKVTTELPKTGDTQMSGLWGLAFLLSGSTLFFLKKRKHKIK